MVPIHVLTHALTAARARTLDDRIDCARLGMLGVLNEYTQNSYRVWANRWADGLGAIDAACANIQANWVASGGAGTPAMDTQVGNLIQACQAWLNSRQACGMPITGWRRPSVLALYWKAAWAYMADFYAQEALNRIAANAAVETAVSEPLNLGFLDPYNDASYVHAPLVPGAPPADRLLRGDSRGPLAIHASNGFQPRNVGNRWNYAPWWAGNATGDTISTTTNQGLAVDAGPAAHATGTATAEGALPPWLAGALGGANRRGYVYEFALLPANSVRMAATAAGHEDVYLAIPAPRIVSWWVVRMDRRTYGPIPFPAPGAAPVGLAWSLNPRELA